MLTDRPYQDNTASCSSAGCTADCHHLAVSHLLPPWRRRLSCLHMYMCRYARSKEHPVDVIAKDIASSTKLLCLDELHVSDVADALILSQVARLLYLVSCVRTVHIVYALALAVTPYSPLKETRCASAPVMHRQSACPCMSRLCVSMSRAC